MARGVRKSPLEKMQMELQEVQHSIQQYENCLATLKAREAQIQENIQIEECKAISELLKSKGLNVNELKEILSEVTEMEQSA